MSKLEVDSKNDEKVEEKGMSLGHIYFTSRDWLQPICGRLTSCKKPT